MCRHLISLLIVLATAAKANAEWAKTASSSEIEAAITRGLKILERGAENYPKHRQCFSCHHQALPILTCALAVGIFACVFQEPRG